jgi:prevent-host-death family protein
MVTVGSKELKNRLGKYLKLVRQGETIQITDRGTPVGCITPVAEPNSASEGDLAVRRLTAMGVLNPGTGVLPSLRSGFKPVRLKPGKSTTEMIREDRR